MKNRSGKILYKGSYKKGISLIVLVITIIVALILIATAGISTIVAIDNANITAFAKDLTEIQDATESYYITNNVMPSITDSTVMDKDELLAIANSGEILTEELTENSDLDSQFYTIDLAKINVTKTAYGNKELGENDIFVISYPTMNVYYPYGVNAKGTIYFSITSKISDITKIPEPQVDTSMTSVISSGGIKVTKINGWANKMGVNIVADMATDELLYMSVSGDPNKLITTTIGSNTFGFNLLSSIIADSETIKVPTLTIEEANYIELGTKPLVDRYVDILKYKDSEIIGKVRIDLSNFSKNLPTITSSNLLSYSSMNTVSLGLSSTDSGIKEVRYEYLTKYTDSGSIDNYYDNITDFDSAYMQSKAKKAKLSSNLTTTISAPKNVRSIKVAIIDKAGNINLYNQEIAPRLYIGYSIDISTPQSLQLTAKMFSINGIKTITFFKSLDGINFTDEQIYTLNTTTNGLTTKQNIPYTDLLAKNVYIKMVAVNYDNTITETRVIKVALIEEKVVAQNKPLLATGMKAVKWNGVSWVTVLNPNEDTSWYNYDTINKQWANAQTEDGSMWVWIPRYEYKIPMPHFDSTIAQTIAVNFLINTEAVATSGYIIHPAFTFGAVELTGIWVAKFEASGSISSIDIKPGIVSLRNVSIDGMFTACRNMETIYGARYGWGTSGIGIDTHLMKNTEWGLVAYLSSSAYGKTGDVSINPNSNFLTGQAGTEVDNSESTSTYAYDDVAYGVQASTTGNIYGIYDMSGGAYEYTAAYVNNGNSNLAIYGSSLISAIAQYKDIYISDGDTSTGNYLANSDKKGDAVYETSFYGYGESSWSNDYSYMPYSINPFFLRGGHYGNSSRAGLFNFHYYIGGDGGNFGFRPVLAVSSTL